MENRNYYKECAMCKEHKPATEEYFRLSRVGKFGLGPFCRSCSAKLVEKASRDAEKNKDVIDFLNGEEEDTKGVVKELKEFKELKEKIKKQGEKNMLEVVGKIYKTMDYDKFMLSEENREIELDSTVRKRQVKSIRENGLLTPIIVKEVGAKYLIIDGHHRFTICKMLNIPLLFFVNNDFDMFQARDCSDTTKKHDKSDIVFRGANYGIPIYKDMQRIYEEYQHMFDSVGGGLFLLTIQYLQTQGYKYRTLEEGINNKENIEKMKTLEYDYDELYGYIEKAVRIVTLAKNKEIDGIGLTSEFIKGYRTSHEHISKNFVGFLVELDNIFTSKKKTDKDIVVLLVSKNRNLIERGLEKIALRVLKK